MKVHQGESSLPPIPEENDDMGRLPLLDALMQGVEEGSPPSRKREVQHEEDDTPRSGHLGG